MPSEISTSLQSQPLGNTKNLYKMLPVDKLIPILLICSYSIIHNEFNISYKINNYLYYN